jgi:hypothetical protein
VNAPAKWSRPRRIDHEDAVAGGRRPRHRIEDARSSSRRRPNDNEAVAWKVVGAEDGFDIERSAQPA